MPLDELTPDALYHLASVAEWAQYQEAGEIAPASLVDEGFVHCSWGHQVAGTVTKHFPDATDLLVLHVDPSLLGSVVLVEEDSYGSGRTYPHAYGAIPAAAVIGSISAA